MKNHLVRAVACATLPLMSMNGALAQSLVTVYGVVDAAAVAARKGGSTVYTLESGVGATSRFGLIGREDLGDGLTAAFQLEGSFKSDSGVMGSTTAQGDASFWNRQSNVSLRSSRWGEVKLGRQLPAQISTALDPFNAVSGFSPYASLASTAGDQGSGASIGDSRISRAISYTTPERYALGAQALVGFRNNSNPGYRTLSAYGAEVHYGDGPLFLQAHYMANNTDPTATLASFRNEWWSVAAQYKFSSMTAAYIYNALRPKKAGYLNSQTHILGLTIPVGNDKILISPVYRTVQGRSDLSSFALGLGYDHNLSKRTNVYVRVGYVDNSRNAIGTLSTARLAKPGDDLPLAAVGMYVRF